MCEERSNCSSSERIEGEGSVDVERNWRQIGVLMISDVIEDLNLSLIIKIVFLEKEMMNLFMKYELWIQRSLDLKGNMYARKCFLLL